MPVPSLLRRSLSPRRIPGNEETLMEKPEYRSALIVGTGPGLSASLARLFAKNGLAVSLAARQTDKLAALAKETGAEVHACNAADPKEVAGLFATLDAGRAPDSLLDPDAIAETYWATLQQHRSAWSWEIEVRPWVEKF